MSAPGCVGVQVASVRGRTLEVVLEVVMRPVAPVSAASRLEMIKVTLTLRTAAAEADSLPCPYRHPAARDPGVTDTVVAAGELVEVAPVPGETLSHEPPLVVLAAAE